MAIFARFGPGKTSGMGAEVGYSRTANERSGGGGAVAYSLSEKLLGGAAASRVADCMAIHAADKGKGMLGGGGAGGARRRRAPARARSRKLGMPGRGRPRE